jgi:hypothetical protein
LAGPYATSFKSMKWRYRSKNSITKKKRKRFTNF